VRSCAECGAGRVAHSDPAIDHRFTERQDTMSRHVGSKFGAVGGPFQLCAAGWGLPRGYVAVLSAHRTVESALRWGRISGQQGRLFIRATPIE